MQILFNSIVLTQLDAFHILRLLDFSLKITMHLWSEFEITCTTPTEYELLIKNERPTFWACRFWFGFIYANLFTAPLHRSPPGYLEVQRPNLCLASLLLLAKIKTSYVEIPSLSFTYLKTRPFIYKTDL